VGKVPTVVPEDSKMRKRLDEYLGYGRRNMQLDDDIWQRWQENRFFDGRQDKDMKGKKYLEHEVKRGEV
jgi:hypothetical protein